MEKLGFCECEQLAFTDDAFINAGFFYYRMAKGPRAMDQYEWLFEIFKIPGDIDNVTGICLWFAAFFVGNHGAANFNDCYIHGFWVTIYRIVSGAARIRTKYYQNLLE